MQELCERKGPADAINKRVFNALQSTITEFPGGSKACEVRRTFSSLICRAVGSCNTAVLNNHMPLDHSILSTGSIPDKVCQGRSAFGAAYYFVCFVYFITCRLCRNYQPAAPLQVIPMAMQRRLGPASESLSCPHIRMMMASPFGYISLQPFHASFCAITRCTQVED